MTNKVKKEYMSFVENDMHYLQCKECGDYQKVSGEEIIVTICSRCLNKKIPIDEPKSKYISTGRPAGWHWMNEYVDKDGNVFHKGKEQFKLKGTLPPTKVKPQKKRKKLNADQKLFKKAAHYKKKLKIKRKDKRSKEK